MIEEIIKEVEKYPSNREKVFITLILSLEYEQRRLWWYLVKTSMRKNDTTYPIAPQKGVTEQEIIAFAGPVDALNWKKLRVALGVFNEIGIISCEGDKKFPKLLYIPPIHFLVK